MRALLLMELFVLSACAAGKPAPVTPAADSTIVKPVDDGVRRARSLAIFAEASKVLLHPRCVNCHPADDSPRQGERSLIHDPPVTRGPGDRGAPAMQCATCHQDRNLQLARVPGATDWHLAPLEMAWLGRTPGQICALLKDPARNGHRTLEGIQQHIAHDPIVAWGFLPGADRIPAPGTQEQLGALFSEWIATGAECPTEEKQP